MLEMEDFAISINNISKEKLYHIFQTAIKNKYKIKKDITKKMNKFQEKIPKIIIESM